MKISILIPTIKADAALFAELLPELQEQSKGFEVEILIDDSETDSIGTKRNRLLSDAKGEYVCFVDSDDMVSTDYVSWLILASSRGFDCASLRGNYYENGKFIGVFEHSIKYTEWETVDGDPKFLRMPNHLNLIKSSIAKQFKFPQINHGEDSRWSYAIRDSGLLKTEFYIGDILYHYYKTTK